MRNHFPLQLEHHDAILAMTQGEEFYGGMDYLPHALRGWLLEAREDNSPRHNFVFTLEGGGEAEVAGFMSLHLLRGRTAAAKFAFRLHREVRGRGYGRAAQQLVTAQLRARHPGVSCAVSAVADSDLTDTEMEAMLSRGRVLTIKCVHEFRMKLESYELLDVKKLKSDGGAELKMLEKAEFRELLLSGELTHLFPDNVVNINWVPALLGTEEDAVFAARKQQLVLVTPGPRPPALSILTLPYPVPGGVRAALDIFALDPAHLESHLLTQLQNLERWRDVITLHASGDEKSVFLSIALDSDLSESFYRVSSQLGLEQFRLIRGREKRKCVKMFIYETDL